MPSTRDSARTASASCICCRAAIDCTDVEFTTASPARHRIATTCLGAAATCGGVCAWWAARDERAADEVGGALVADVHAHGPLRACARAKPGTPR